MHRFFLPLDPAVGGRVTLDERESAHAVRVLRLEAGDAIEVLNGAGRVLACRILEAHRRAVVAEVTGERRVPALPPARVVPAVLKGRAMEFLVQKVTELGVGVISPVLAARCVAGVGAGREAADKAEGWRVTAMEACKQCGNPWLPTIEAPVPLAAFLERRAAGPLLVGVLDPAAPSLGRVATELARTRVEVSLLIGPEGDWTAEEQDRLRGAGVVPFSLGPLVLRAETAAIAGLAVLQQAREASG